MLDKVDPSEWTKYNFEFIIQGLLNGEWQIPSQDFTFFDVGSRTYKTLQTMPLSLMIMPQTPQQQQFIPPPEEAEAQATSAADEGDDIAPLMRMRPVGISGRSSLSLPLWL